MSGTVEGGKKAAQKVLERFGQEQKKEWSRQGGLKKHPKKGWGSATPAERREAGRRGGSITAGSNPEHTPPQDSLSAK